jgi:hypothetical protein
MRRSAPITLALLAALWCVPGRAQEVTTQDFQVRNTGQLANLCSAGPKDKEGVAAINFCHGFTQAAVDMQFTEEREQGQKRSICFPNPPPKRTTTIGEFVTWARAKPDRLATPPTKGFLDFMAERFPCP